METPHCPAYAPQIAAKPLRRPDYSLAANPLSLRDPALRHASDPLTPWPARSPYRLTDLSASFSTAKFVWHVYDRSVIMHWAGHRARRNRTTAAANQT